MTTHELLTEIEHRAAKVKAALAQSSQFTDVYIEELKAAVKLIPTVRKAEMTQINQPPRRN